MPGNNSLCKFLLDNSRNQAVMLFYAKKILFTLIGDKCATKFHVCGGG